MSTATITEPSIETSTATDRLTEALEQKLSHPATSPDFDLHAATNEVLKDIGLQDHDVRPLRITTRVLSAYRLREIVIAFHRSLFRSTGFFFHKISVPGFSRNKAKACRAALFCAAFNSSYASQKLRVAREITCDSNRVAHCLRLSLVL